ncbi:MAG: DNA polymerase Y family protein [Acidobacteriota bacterium]
MDRLACVDVPALPLQMLLRMQPAWVNLPVAVVEDDRPHAPVLFLNERARRAGVRQGQRYATALGLSTDLRAAVVPRTQLEQTVALLVEGLRRYSPHVEPAADAPGVFWLDASGLNRLYPSLQAWAKAVRLDLQRADFRATVAVGVTRFGTYALARSYRSTAICVEAGEERSAVQRVLLAHLDLQPDTLARLQTLGITTVGEFLRLPEDGIRQRFGAAADALYQSASGRRWTPLVPVPADEPHERELHFDAPETNTEGLVFVVKRLLDAVLAGLRQRAQAVAELSLSLMLDDRTSRLERVRPASPTVDAAQLLALVRLRLDALRLPAGIITLRLAAAPCSAAPPQRQLLAEIRRDADAANQALARVRAECGDDCVVRASVRDAHLPAARFGWERLDRVTTEARAQVVAARPLVRRIYAQPIPLAHGSRLPALAGPYILSGGWWGGGVRRDYYFAHTGEGNLQWLYHDHRQARVFLQGGVE